MRAEGHQATAEFGITIVNPPESHGRRKRSSSGSMVTSLAMSEIHPESSSRSVVALNKAAAMLKHSASQNSIAGGVKVRSPLASQVVLPISRPFLAVGEVDQGLVVGRVDISSPQPSSSKLFIQKQKNNQPTQTPPKNLATLPSIATSLLPAQKAQPHQNPPKGAVPFKVQIRPSLCGQFTVVAETYGVPLLDCTGSIPMDRRCTTAVYGHAIKARGAVLLIPGFASNRAVFDMGGGKCRDGPSFFEYLARRGYDTFAIDLRGSRQAMRMGSKPPAFMKEHVEVDVPSAIKFIKTIGRYEKVYLIGHSMGGAISCAVAGHIPDDIAGIVHLAGLYHYTIPYVHDFLEFYRARCPTTVRNAIRTSAGIALRSAVSILSPTVSSLLHFLSPPPSTRCIEAPATPSTPGSTESEGAPNLQVAPPPNSLSALSRSLFVELRRKPIPLRSAVDFCLYLKKFVPTKVEKFLMNCMYPSPWLPYSVDDPWALVDMSAESPTIGIYIAITKMAVQDDVYNNWVLESVSHRAEVQQIEEGAQNYEAAPIKSQRSKSLSDALPSISSKGLASLAHITAQASTLTTSTKLKQALQPVLEPLSIGDSSESGDPCASADGSAEPMNPVASPTPTRPTSSKSIPTPVPTPSATPPPAPTAAGKAVEANPSWNELAPYLERFEQLEHLPLFFCPANADAILRKEDTMAGYRRSGSRWKEVIEYGGEKKKPSPVVSLSEFERGGGGGVGARPKVVLTIGDEGDGSESSGGSRSSSVTTSPEPVFAKPMGKSGKRRSMAASIRFTPLKDDSGICLQSSDDSCSSSSDATTAPTMVESPASSACSSSSSLSPALEAEKKGGGRSAGNGKPGLKPRYAVPEDFSYGHCDILGGRHAEKVWERIADWLDATTAREKEWRFRRRYSAK
ncbi:hypothetical protein HDU67_001610 [Dinochytrium kinnereticum]|nr:hypothetical protein HDU67_001610 [Dinochytrium kinnereticum]